MDISSVVPASTLAMPTDFAASLSPDALMVYLTTRLNGIDEQINTIFNTEKQQQKVQTALRGLQTAVSEFDENAAAGTAIDAGKLKDVQDALQELKNVDPELGAAVQEELEKAGLLSEDAPAPVSPDGSSDASTPPTRAEDTQNRTHAFTPPNDATGQPPGGAGSDPSSDSTAIPTGKNTQFSGTEVKASTEYLSGITKDIESQSQMNMIHLQSLMSARQTAIQLATNMISALGESSKAIAANIGR